MKKMIVMLLAVAMLLSLCACGESENKNTNNTTVPTTTAPENTAPQQTTQPSVPETTAPQQTAKDLAISCIDKSVDELYALVGEPNETDYVPSCLMEGEDGMLIYDDFVVYTYRLNGEETVVDVE